MWLRLLLPEEVVLLAGGEAHAGSGGARMGIRVRIRMAVRKEHIAASEIARGAWRRILEDLRGTLLALVHPDPLVEGV